MAKKLLILDNHPFAFPEMQVFPAYVYNVVDGDTIDCVIALPFDNIGYERLRVRGIDTPERGQFGWDEATSLTASLVMGKQVKIITYKDNKTLGRYVADVFFMTKSGWVSLAAELKRNNF